MFFTTSAALLGLALVNSGVLAEVHDITVGGADGTLAFSPEAISANPGDQVVFHFQQKNHTATQSSFADPCALKEGGFNSGFQFVPTNQTDNFPTYTISVNDTNPIWVYCAQGKGTAASHCGKGMVFAVNCGLDGSPNSFTNFKGAALAEGAMLAAEASSASAMAATETSAMAGESATNTWTAAYGDATIPPVEPASTVVATVEMTSSTWTTTYASYPGSAAPTPASLTGNVYKVIVGGNNTLTFDPPSLQALPRDTIIFEFQSKNHTVTQSSFAAPCLHLDNTTSGAVGFDSGFMPVAANSTDFPTWNFTVKDTAPVWAYCRQTNPKSHCGAGMVFALNAVETSARSFSAFQSLAEQLNGTTTTASGAAASASATDSGAARFGGSVLAVVIGSVIAAAALL